MAISAPDAVKKNKKTNRNLKTWITGLAVSLTVVVVSAGTTLGVIKSNIDKKEAEAEAKINQLLKDNASFQEENVKLQDIIKGRDLLVSYYKEQISKLEKEVADAKNNGLSASEKAQYEDRIEELTIKLSRVESENVTLRGSISILQTSVDDLTAQLKIAEEQAKKGDEEAKKLVEAYKIQIDNLNKSLEQQKTDYENKITALNNRIVELTNKTALSEAEKKELEQLRNLYPEATQIIENQQKIIDEKDIEIENLKKQSGTSKELQEKINRLEQEKTALENEYAKQNKELIDLTLEITELERELAEAEQVLGSKNGLITELSARIAVLEAELDKKSNFENTSEKGTVAIENGGATNVANKGDEKDQGNQTGNGDISFDKGGNVSASEPSKKGNPGELERS